MDNCKECGFKNGHAPICSQYIKPKYKLSVGSFKKSKRVSNFNKYRH